ncbi:hypothetical protein NLI92_000254 [Priestia megaterium]|uniref:lipopolysaccharide biosynthesis protein n=1 Tax=Priestia megaterium TaxID=1404 RepID=UPI0021AC6225|nr:oligosaccharide flippase family protein [Priestia megaterium]MCR8925003.1 hypothetical protein [Priestia megaterium]
MRTTNSIKNISIGILSALIITVLGFISRKIFLDNLGTEYLGINGLLTSVLSMIALIEAGIGSSIVYHLYKPLADNDKSKIIAFIQLYKKAYRVLAVLIFVLSILLYPFLNKLMEESDTISSNILTAAYFLFVLKNMVSYLNAYKVSLINADQKQYILTRINIGFQLFTTLAKIIVLIYMANFIIYLIVELATFLVQTIFNGWVVEKRYSYIKTKEKYSISVEEKKSLVKNVKALFLHNIGTFCVFGTDNILIASFVSVVTVGLYSNYTMIISQLSSLLSPILDGIGASIGNLIAKESKDKSYSVFRAIYLINFWIYSVSVIFLYILLEPFLNWWLGHGYLLDSLTFIIVLFNFYITGMRASILTFKIKGGIFVQDQYVPLIEAIVNLGASLILVQYMGLAGIFIGTAISTLSIVFWNAPRLVYKYVFQIPVWSYFTRYFLYIGLTLLTCFITVSLCDLLVEGNNFLSLILKGIICLIAPNTIYFLIFYKSEEFRYINQVINTTFLSVKTKIKHVS